MKELDTKEMDSEEQELYSMLRSKFNPKEMEKLAWLMVIDAKKYHQEKLNNNIALGDVINSLPTKDEFVSKGWSIARSSQYSRRKSVQNKVDDIYYSGWMDCYDWMINNDL